MVEAKGPSKGAVISEGFWDEASWDLGLEGWVGIGQEGRREEALQTEAGKAWNTKLSHLIG